MNVLEFLFVTLHVTVILPLVVLSVSFVDEVTAVPPDYCLHPLNTSDCNEPPTPVFYYYKPGSRCEIGFWRGCPTHNKFPDEVACSNICIFRMRPHSEENIVEHTDPKDEFEVWKEELFKITDDEADEMGDILDEIVDHHNIIKLKFTLAPEQDATETGISTTLKENDKTTVDDNKATTTEVTKDTTTEATVEITTVAKGIDIGLGDEVVTT